MSNKASTTLSSARPRKATLAGVLLLAAAALSGCSALTMSRHEIVGSVPDDYRTRHPIVLTDSLAVLDVPATRSMMRLPPDARSNVVAFGQRFAVSGASALAIVTPRGSANQAAAQRIANEIKYVLAGSGVPTQMISFRSYPALPRDTEAPVRIAYSSVVARTDQCGQWPDQTTWNPENRNYENFACATQQNLAAMLANPLDIAYPRASTPADAERRSGVIEKYRGGAAYQSDYSKETKSDISSGTGG